MKGGRSEEKSNPKRKPGRALLFRRGIAVDLVGAHALGRIFHRGFKSRMKIDSGPSSRMKYRADKQPEERAAERERVRRVE